uniref:Uncharacterized protein n=1 Tax=viral metagenome TaxID=1070528 RepID=A0A6C0DBE0_9ZZZZ
MSTSNKKIIRTPSDKTLNSSIKSSKSKSKSIKSSNNKTKKTMNDLIPILSEMNYNENPEFFNLLNTNKQYKKEINRINELELKIKKNEKKIEELSNLINDNDILYGDYIELLYDNDNYLIESESKRLRNLMNNLELEKKQLETNIDNLEAEIEEIDLLIKIWQSNKINENKKKQLEKEYSKKYKEFNNKIKAIQNKINKLYGQTFERKYPNIQRTVFDEENNQWVFDTDEKQRLFDQYNDKRNSEISRLSEQENRLNDEFYRVYNKIEKIIK